MDSFFHASSSPPLSYAPFSNRDSRENPFKIRQCLNLLFLDEFLRGFLEIGETDLAVVREVEKCCETHTLLPCSDRVRCPRDDVGARERRMSKQADSLHISHIFSC